MGIGKDEGAGMEIGKEMRDEEEGAKGEFVESETGGTEAEVAEMGGGFEMVGDGSESDEFDKPFVAEADVGAEHLNLDLNELTKMVVADQIWMYLDWGVVENGGIWSDRVVAEKKDWMLLERMWEKRVEEVAEGLNLGLDENED
ncbi:hypothetical protein U1Q18_046721 [Sarracenia purpurea var. burkii]